MGHHGGMPRHRLRRPAATLAVLCTALGVTACTTDTGGSPASSSASSGAPTTSTPTSAVPTSTTPTSTTPTSAVPTSTTPTSTTPTSAVPTSTTPTSTAPTSTAPTSPAQRALAAMSLPEEVGQLIMVDCPSTAVAAATVTAIEQQHVGSVILDGNSYLSITQTRAITDRLQAHAPRGVGLFVATDQEGGLVQRMRGPGFASIPSALAQGRLAPATLRADARKWGDQLRRAGITVDLAPVLGTVPADGGSNPPIGDLDREFGHTVQVVTTHGVAVVHGLADAGVDATAKHFPGLGRVSGNTDTTSGVTDTVTTPHDPYLQPFAAAVAAGVPFMMMSTAIYSRIDPGTPAAFSRPIVTGLLRTQLHFSGVIVSDDIGAARQVSGYSPATRALDFVRAGGDMLLTVDPSVVAPMATAMVQQAQHHARFRALVRQAALTVLRAKQARGLLH